MQLSEIFNALSYGEFSQIRLGGASAEGITPENHPHILSHVNLGLTELHKRFLLKENRLTLQLSDGISTYVLDKKYAAGNREAFGGTRYILDSFDRPFQNDVLKVERVFDASGVELLLNAGDDPGNLYHINIRTPAYNMLTVPAHLRSPTLSVVYRAKHPEIIREDKSFDPTEVEVDLPYSHLEALIYYVASRVFNPIGSGGDIHDGNNYAAKFEAACMVLENQGLSVTVGEANHRLYQKGFV